jgi:DNA replication protein DnaC
MRELASQIQGLRLYGKASAWEKLAANEADIALQSARWLIERWLAAEMADRAMGSVRYQMKAARFPLYRDLAGFDFAKSCVERQFIVDLSHLSFTEQAHNVVFVGGPGTGKTHLAIAIGVSGITRHKRRVRFF